MLIGLLARTKNITVLVDSEAVREDIVNQMEAFILRR